MPNRSIESIISEIERKELIDTSTLFDIVRACSVSLKDPKKENEGRRLIINILENFNKISTEHHELVSDLVEMAGFYPYLEKNKLSLKQSTLSGQIRKELHSSKNLTDTYLHEEQKILYTILETSKNLVVSAPTSFGKSLLIEELVASYKFKNIVVIQPTLALLDETRKKLSKYTDYYKLNVRTSQLPSDQKGNIFLFTGERVQEYKKFPKIDLLVVDEFYKLSRVRDDERWDTLNNAVYQILSEHSCKFYLLGPNIDGISDGFSQRYNAEFYKTDFSLVDNKVIDYYTANKTDFDLATKNKPDKEAISKKENELFKLLFQQRQQQNIIYCSNPERARSLSFKYLDFLKKTRYKAAKEALPLSEWIKVNIGDRWKLIECLEYAIGFHDGALQKHISSSIINYFNEGKIKFLFCTSTIIEGVNTSAKNIIVFDKKKGPKEIDFFDYSNIKGRAGRMMVHYVGNIYNFIAPPKKNETIVVDIPFYEQKDLTKEVLNNMKTGDIKNKSSKEYKELMKIPADQRALFKRNGVSVDGQVQILTQIQQDLVNKPAILKWKTSYPTYEQLNYILNLAWNNLLKKSESRSPVNSASNLTRITFNVYKPDATRTIMWLVNDLISSHIADRDNYLSEEDKMEKSLKRMSSDDKREFKKSKAYKDYYRGKVYKDMTDGDIYNDSITDAFQIYRHWFQYKVPKWINVINEIQRYACAKKNIEASNYSYYANIIENDRMKENLSLLMEYSIPTSAIKKLENLISSNISQDDVINEIKRRKLYNNKSLMEYERQKLMENL